MDAAVHKMFMNEFFLSNVYYPISEHIQNIKLKNMMGDETLKYVIHKT